MAGLHDAGPRRVAPTTETELRWIYTAWLGAFLLKMLGSSWDVSWHFRWLRDDLAPPHLLNSAGTAVVIGLVIFHSYSGYGVDRRALRLMQWGIGMFLIAIPIDIVNHRINGLDITSWSPSHGLLYLGTAIMLAGAIRGWWLYAAPGRIRNLVSLGLWLFFVENVLFPNQHQEYGVLSLRDYLDGHTTAEPRCWTSPPSQGQTPTQFMLPGAVLGAPRLAGLRRACWRSSSPARSSACGGRRPPSPAAYLAYRAVMWLLLVGWASRRRCCRSSCSSARCWSTSPSPSGCPAGPPGRSSPASSTASPSARRRSACCRPWNWWSVLPVAVVFGLLWGGVDLLERSRWLARWKSPGRARCRRSAPRPDPRRTGAETGARRAR